uniref:Uncharacterized protein n=1 Tax=Arion vulgaris TaxID=1028688 RepID=A0A0B7AFD7_9EUPU
MKNLIYFVNLNPERSSLNWGVPGKSLGNKGVRSEIDHITQCVPTWEVKKYRPNTILPKMP